MTALSVTATEHPAGVVSTQDWSNAAIQGF